MNHKSNYRIISFSLTLALAALTFQAQALAQNDINCVIEEHGTLSEEEAYSAASILCRELRERGWPTTRPLWESDPNSEEVMVNIHRLGNSVFFEVVHQRNGVTSNTESMQLESLEDLPLAARRLAEALSSGVPVTRTARYHNLVGEETRPIQTLPGSTYWGVGIVGVTLPAQGVYAAPGAAGRFSYEAATHSVGTEFILAGNGEGGLVSWGVGGRYYLSPENNSLFVGGGLAFEGIFTGSHAGNGLAFYGEGGVQLFRLHRSRLTVGVRTSIPTFELSSEDYYSACSDYYYEDCEQGSRPSDTYTIPVTINATYSW